MALGCVAHSLGATRGRSAPRLSRAICQLELRCIRTRTEKPATPRKPAASRQCTACQTDDCGDAEGGACPLNISQRQLGQTDIGHAPNHLRGIDPERQS